MQNTQHNNGIDRSVNRAIAKLVAVARRIGNNWR